MVARRTIAPYLFDVSVVNGYAYIAAGSAGVAIVEVGQRAGGDPRVVGWVSTITAGAVEAAGDTLLVSTIDSSELHVLDVTEPAVPVNRGSLRVEGPVKDVTIGDGVAYVLSYDALEVVDVSGYPTRVGALNTEWGGALSRCLGSDRICCWGAWHPDSGCT